jgi:hypothetical protein
MASKAAGWNKRSGSTKALSPRASRADAPDRPRPTHPHTNRAEEPARTNSSAEAIDVGALGEQVLPVMGDDSEEEAAAGDLGAPIVTHRGMLRGKRWNRCACSTPASRRGA